MPSKSRKLFVVKPDPKDRVGPPHPERSGPPEPLRPPPGPAAPPADPPVQYLGLPALERISSGAPAPVSGIYRAYHYQHRLPHSVFAHKDQLMPACARCGDRIQYGLLLSAGCIDEDVDLNLPVRKVG